MALAKKGRRGPRGGRAAGDPRRRPTSGHLGHSGGRRSVRDRLFWALIAPLQELATLPLRRPGEAVGALAYVDEFFDLPARKVHDGHLAALIAGDVSHAVVRPDQYFLWSAGNVDAARHLHRLKIDHGHLVRRGKRDQQPAAIERGPRSERF